MRSIVMLLFLLLGPFGISVLPAHAGMGVETGILCCLPVGDDLPAQCPDCPECPQKHCDPKGRCCFHDLHLIHPPLISVTTGLRTKEVRVSDFEMNPQSVASQPPSPPPKAAVVR